MGAGKGGRRLRSAVDLLVDRVPRLRVLVILTFRPEFAPPWIGRPHVTMLTLNRLPRRQGAEMIAYVTGGKALPKEVPSRSSNAPTAFRYSLRS
jgi:predicted ATPase